MSNLDHIRQSLSKRDTPELHAIWERNDRGEWTDEAFAAIGQILKDRGETLRAQQVVSEKDEEKILAVVPRTHCWRRFFARWLDVSYLSVVLFAAKPVLIWALLYAPLFLVRLTAALGEPVLLLTLLYVLLIPVEAVLLSTTSTTLGKWTLGMRVVELEGSKPSFSTALSRAVRVFLVGNALGIGFLTPFAHYYGYRTLTRTGTTPWDSAAGTRVEYSPWSFKRWVITVGAVVVLVLLSMLASPLR